MKLTLHALLGFLYTACPGGMVFQSCSQYCPKTCQDYKSDSCIENANCQQTCFCTGNNLLENGTCIPTDQCGCYDHLGQYVAPGDTVDGRFPCHKWWVYSNKARILY